MKTKISLLFLFLFLAATLLLQAHFLDKRYGELSMLSECPWCENKDLVEDVVYVPLNASIMRLVAPADPHFLADLLWMRASYYFGQHMLTDREYPYLFHLIDLITDLSSFWEQPYIFGAVILPSETETVEDGFSIIEKGLIYHPDDWRLWFFKGYYLWKSHGDIISAAEAMHKASLLPGSPLYLAGLSATLATQAGQKELARRFLEESLKNIQDPTQREFIHEKITEMLRRDDENHS